MRTWLAIFVTLAACKNPDLAELEAVKRDACACKDARCADQAMERIARASIKQTPQARAIAREIMDCRAKLDDATRPTTDPDAEDSAAGPPAAAEPSGGPPAR